MLLTTTFNPSEFSKNQNTLIELISKKVKDPIHKESLKASFDGAFCLFIAFIANRHKKTKLNPLERQT